MHSALPTNESPAIDSQRRPLHGGARRAAAMRWMLAAVSAIGIGLAIGWVAQRVSVHWAPLVIFPLLMGGLLGLACGRVLAALALGRSVPAVLLAAAAALALSVGQHAASYQQQRRAWEEQVARKPALLLAARADEDLAPPETFFQFLQQEARRGRRLTAQWTVRGGMAWGSWAADALLAAIAAAAAAGWTIRHQTPRPATNTGR